MGATGTALIDFGTFPGGSDASLAITGQGGIIAGSIVEAWLLPTATADHTADEHIVNGPKVFAGNIVAGTGFTIYLVNDDSCDGGDTIGGSGKQVASSNNAATYGVWNVAWVWN